MMRIAGFMISIVAMCVLVAIVVPELTGWQGWALHAWCLFAALAWMAMLQWTANRAADKLAAAFTRSGVGPSGHSFEPSGSSFDSRIFRVLEGGNGLVSYFLEASFRPWGVKVRVVSHLRGEWPLFTLLAARPARGADPIFKFRWRFSADPKTSGRALTSQQEDALARLPLSINRVESDGRTLSLLGWDLRPADVPALVKAIDSL